MITIWKYPFQSIDGGHVPMPHGARIVALQKQGDIPTLWAVVDTDATLENRWFRVYGTGHRINNPDTKHYIGTWQDGPFVWHLFEAQP